MFLAELKGSGMHSFIQQRLGQRTCRKRPLFGTLTIQRLSKHADQNDKRYAKNSNRYKDFDEGKTRFGPY